MPTELLHIFLSHEFHARRIDAMSGVFGSEALATEYVPEMPSTVATFDFGTHAVGIGFFCHVVGNHVVEAGPTAAGVKLVSRTEKGVIATLADERALLFYIIQLSRKGALRALFLNDIGLLL